jgi:hypothetical protein
VNIELAFRPIAFPYRVQTASPYSLEFQSTASLFDRPKYGGLNVDFWKTIDSDGWRTCKAGYAVFTKKIPGSRARFLILHGLKVKGICTTRGRSEGLSVLLEPSKVEAYVDSFLQSAVGFLNGFDDQVETRVRALVTENVHEIRSMNTSLYHAGYELQEKLRYDDRYKLALARNVVALSELVSVRIELADLTASNLFNPAGASTAPLSAYKKFDKITKCYLAYASKREISINLSGNSQGLTNGVEHFEMIPLITIDNAVKYSPDKMVIEVMFQENANEIRCEVRSLGPKIEDSEKKSIFEKESRGVHAVASGRGGSGIGLNFARQLMKVISAEIYVSQEVTATKVKGVEFFPTTFTMVFPRSQAGRSV